MKKRIFISLFTMLLACFTTFGAVEKSTSHSPPELIESESITFDGTQSKQIKVEVQGSYSIMNVILEDKCYLFEKVVNLKKEIQLSTAALYLNLTQLSSTSYIKETSRYFFKYSKINSCSYLV